MAQYTCLECGKPFSAAPSTKHNFCSRDCTANHYARTRARDLTGERFGKLVVVSRIKSPENAKGRGAWWACICDCGGDRQINAHTLTSGRIKSCGCIGKRGPNFGGGKPKQTYICDECGKPFLAYEGQRPKLGKYCNIACYRTAKLRANSLIGQADTEPIRRRPRQHTGTEGATVYLVQEEDGTHKRLENHFTHPERTDDASH